MLIDCVELAGRELSGQTALDEIRSIRGRARRASAEVARQAAVRSLRQLYRALRDEARERERDGGG